MDDAPLGALDSSALSHPRSPRRAARRSAPEPHGGPKPAPMYAIVEISGKQFKVQQDDTLYVPRQKGEVGDEITFDRVLLTSGDGGVSVGAPTVSGASVTATVLAHVKGDKIIVFKKKRRKGYKVKNGHRQPYTQIQIGGLSVN